MTQLYECMFVLNNDSVRAGWADVKSSVTATVEKHGGKVLSARHWAERRLAYPIRHKNRATYLRAFCDMPPEGVDTLSRELNISEMVLRYLFLSAEEVPAEELELSGAEQEKEFSVPEPPADDAIDQVEEAPAEGSEAKAEGTPEAKAEDATEAKAEGATEAEAEGATEEKAEAPAEAAPAPEATPAPQAGKEETAPEASEDKKES